MPDGDQDRGHLRIGELSHRVGVSPEVLRAWERRYHLFSPGRTAGGFRLYSDADEARVRRMLDHVASGVSAAEAAQLAAGVSGAEVGAAVDTRSDLGALRARLCLTLNEFDDAGAQSALDQLLASFSLEAVLRDTVLPYLRDLGERWRRGEASIAQEHFASALLRGRLLGLARGWGSGSGPRGLLACLPGDQHDLPLICFGLALRGHGWRITFLGPDTPLATITEMARHLQPAVVVVSAALPERVAAARAGLQEAAGYAPVVLAGGGATREVAAAVGVRYLDSDPVTAADEIAAIEPGEWSGGLRSRRAGAAGSALRPT